jgi:hypothetical protein
MNSTGYWITKGLIVGTVLLWIVEDFVIYWNYGNAATISRETLNTAQGPFGPVFCGLVGVLVCHLSVPRMEGSGIDGWRWYALLATCAGIFAWLAIGLIEWLSGNLWERSAIAEVWSVLSAYPMLPILFGFFVCMLTDLQQHPVVGEAKPRLIGLPHFGGTP